VQGEAILEPWLNLLPSPGVHPTSVDLAAGVAHDRDDFVDRRS
jgi:hypothetical protein